MTVAQYKAQNELGFEGDRFLKEEFQKIIDRHKIGVLIETGSYLGSTTRQFASMAPIVVTIEINPEYYACAAEKCQGMETRHYLGNSADVLPEILAGINTNVKLLVFADAHWAAYNPLLDELKAIKESGFKPVIVIHDFKVPDHPELGFDSYAGQDYEWSWIEESVNNIYGKDGYTYYYNSEAEGAKRGVIFIEPK